MSVKSRHHLQFLAKKGDKRTLLVTIFPPFILIAYVEGVKLEIGAVSLNISFDVARKVQIQVQIEIVLAGKQELE